MSDCILIYVTVGSEDEAETIARQLVAQRLVACANLLPVMRSFYRWEGAVESGREVVLLLKTQRDRFEAVRAQIRSLHSYKLPCIVAVDITTGDADFLQWVAAESTP